MFDAKLVEFELTLSDPVHEFDAGDGRRGSSKMLEPEHRTKPQLDRSMVLFNQIVDVFGRPDLALISLGMFAESLCRPAMRRGNWPWRWSASARSRKLSLYRRYQRTQSTMISWSKCRP